MTESSPRPLPMIVSLYWVFQLFSGIFHLPFPLDQSRESVVKMAMLSAYVASEWDVDIFLYLPVGRPRPYFQKYAFREIT